eukprot:GFUD01007982.1.p1 GENE.GFUD01007982.1~~GFUD01007982.1.p1  ORF type:complete len:140 (-),score=18.16 GFUD01007982.1:589-1008(-)
MNPGRIAMVTCRRVRVQRRKVVMYLVAGILWWLVKTYCWPLKIIVNEDSFTERSKCPACFGTSLCSDLQSGDILNNTVTIVNFKYVFSTIVINLCVLLQNVHYFTLGYIYVDIVSSLQSIDNLSMFSCRSESGNYELGR